MSEKKEITKKEKRFLLNQIENTMINHPIRIGAICDWIFVAGIVSDSGYNPIDLLKLVEDRNIEQSRH